MKKTRTVLILAGVILLITAGIIVTKTVKKHVDKVNTVDEVIFTFDPESVTEISLEKTETELSLTLTKEGDVWKDTSDEAFPVDEARIDDLLAEFKEVHASFSIEEATLSDYGLSSPEGTITVKIGDEAYTMDFGGYSTMDEKRYVSIGDGRAFLIDEDLLNELPDDRDELLKNDEIPVIAVIEEASSSGEAAFTIVYDEEKRSYTEDYVYYMDEDGEYLPLGESNVLTWVNITGYLDLSEYVSYEASAEDLSGFGLADKTITVSVRGFDQTEEEAEESGTEREELSYSVEFGFVEAEEETSAADEDAETSADEEEEIAGDTYFRVNGSEIIYKTDGSVYQDLLSASYNSLRPKEVLSVNWDNVISVDFTVEDNEYTVDFSEEPSEEDEEELVTVYRMDGEEIDFSGAEKAVDALTYTVFTELNEKGLLECAFTVHFDDEEYPEVSVEIYRYNGKNCLVYVDGVMSGQLSRSYMADAREAFLELALGEEE